MALCPRVSKYIRYTPFSPTIFLLRREGHPILPRKTGSEKFLELHEVLLLEVAEWRLEPGLADQGCSFVHRCPGLSFSGLLVLGFPSGFL